MQRFASVFVAATLLFSTSLAPSAEAQGAPDFSRYVAIGDGFTAGYQDGALYDRGQATSYAAVLAAAAGVPSGLPLVEAPGFPTPNSVTGLGLLKRRPGECEYGAVDLATGRSTGRVDPSAKATILAVPFQTVEAVVTARWRVDPANPNDPVTFEDLVLGYPYALTGEREPSSQLETAVALEPTFVSVWVGTSDLFLAALRGDGSPTPVADFSRRVDEIFEALDGTGASGVVVNVLDVTSSPLLVSFKDLKKRTGLSVKQMKKRLGVNKTAYVTIASLPTVDAIVDGRANGPLAPSQIVTEAELASLKDHAERYNRKLASVARDRNWPLVDVNEIFARYASRGVDVAGAGRLTTSYLGGLYGLDGFHPSDTGQALIALAVISAINVGYGTSLPLPNVAAVAAEDPNICR